jgi:hypothetical protein
LAEASGRTWRWPGGAWPPSWSASTVRRPNWRTGPADPAGPGRRKDIETAGNTTATRSSTSPVRRHGPVDIRQLPGQGGAVRGTSPRAYMRGSTPRPAPLDGRSRLPGPPPPGRPGRAVTVAGDRRAFGCIRAVSRAAPSCCSPARSRPRRDRRRQPAPGSAASRPLDRRRPSYRRPVGLPAHRRPRGHRPAHPDNAPRRQV